MPKLFDAGNSNDKSTGKGKGVKAKAPVTISKIEKQDEGISMLIVLSFYNA